MAHESILISINPVWIEKILSNKKKIELRRRPPKLTHPTLAVLYATAPISSIVGTCIFSEIISDSIENFWKNSGAFTGCTKGEFLKYFSGCKRATGLVIQKPVKKNKTVPLQEMRRRGITPPVSWRWLEDHHKLLVE